MLNSRQVSILGCGWLGLPLAELLIESGYIVKGSSTTLSKMDELQTKQIIPFLLKLPTISPPTEFFNTDILVVNIPPQSRSKDKNHHLQCIKTLIDHVKPRTKILYVSATSVYPDIDEEITEQQPVDRSSDRAKALWQVEELLKEHFETQLTIIRMGGLLGYDRIPGRYFAGKEISNSQQKVNYIHRDDAIGLIKAVLDQGIWGEIFNGVAPLHPTRSEVFQINAEAVGFPPPISIDNKSENVNRFVSSAKIEQKLDYSFIYPDPRDFHYTF